MDHHPLQRELAIKAAGADAAAKRLTEIRDRRATVKARLHSLGEQAAAARDGLRTAAGASAAGEGDAKAVQGARKALRDLEGEYELAGIEVEGIDARVTEAEREQAKARRAMCLAGVDVTRMAVSRDEDGAREAFALFAGIMRRRHALAKLAGSLATEAAGRPSEPIPWSSETCGLLRRDLDDEGFAGVLRAHGLTQTFAPTVGVTPATLASLLEIELPAETEAQAAE